jgi:hypothetical protein
VSLDRRLVGATIAEDPEQVRDLLTAATEQERRSADEPLREQLGRLIPPRDPLPGHGAGRVNAAHGSPGAPDGRYDFELSRTSFPDRIQGRKGFEASPSLNQLDFFGYWKVLDALIADAAPRKLPNVVFGRGAAEQLFLGTWPDGVAFKKLRIETPCDGK